MGYWADGQRWRWWYMGTGIWIYVVLSQVCFMYRERACVRCHGLKGESLGKNCWRAPIKLSIVVILEWIVFIYINIELKVYSISLFIITLNKYPFVHLFCTIQMVWHEWAKNLSTMWFCNIYDMYVCFIILLSTIMHVNGWKSIHIRTLESINGWKSTK